MKDLHVKKHTISSLTIIKSFFQKESDTMHYIPLAIPNFEGNERKYVDDAVQQGWVSIAGAYVVQLEKEIASYINLEEVAACQNATSGLHLALIDAGIQPGDMIIVPTLTFIAAVNPVRYQFAIPVFMDCDDSFCMDPVKLKEFCENECTFRDNALYHNESGRHIKAIVVTHVFGNLADMESIMDVAEQYNLIVVEDSSEAMGTHYTTGRFAGKFAGTIGDYGVYSFNGNKLITTGGGGVVFSKHPDRVRHMRYLSAQAKDDTLFYLHHEVGYNYRMTNVQAALGVAQMEEFPDFLERKQRNFALYEKEFESFPYARLHQYREGTYCNKWFYGLIIDFSKLDLTLKDLIAIMDSKQVQTRSLWGLIHLQRPYQQFATYKIEKALEYSDCVLNIPCGTQLTEEEIKFVATSLKEAMLAHVKK